MSDYVGLNVGGKIYRTSRLTLTRYPDSFFSTLLDSDIPSDKDDQGNYLVDQDGKIFRHVLNFLRNGELELPEGFNELGSLRRQADFFLLPALKDSIEKHSSRDNVGLNVGGKIYRTSRLTLTRYPDSFFSTLLDSDIPSDKDDQGNYVIDQDGELFRHVLNFLRNGELELPEGFNELGSLRRQADFFLLPALKDKLDGLRSVGLMFDNGNLFNTTKETLSKEEDSFFTKMLKGEVAVSRDSHGNYIMDRDGSGFHHILNYLRDGGIFNSVTSDELERLQKDAKHFGLNVFGNHVQSINSILGNNHSLIHLYLCGMHYPCVTYSKSSQNSIHRFNDNMFTRPVFTIIDQVQSGLVNMDKINPSGPATIQDVENYLRKLVIHNRPYTRQNRDFSRHGRVQVNHVQLNPNCTRLEGWF